MRSALYAICLIGVTADVLIMTGLTGAQPAFTRQSSNHSLMCMCMFSRQSTASLTAWRCADDMTQVMSLHQYADFAPAMSQNISSCHRQGLDQSPCNDTHSVVLSELVSTVACCRPQGAQNTVAE